MAGVRDLIALTLHAFAEPAALDKIPVAPTSSDNQLHLSAVGSSLSTPKADGGASPASSMTSEQVSLADVDERVAASSAAASRTGKLLSGRKLSFTRAAKKK